MENTEDLQALVEAAGGAEWVVKEMAQTKPMLGVSMEEMQAIRQEGKGRGLPEGWQGRVLR